MLELHLSNLEVTTNYTIGRQTNESNFSRSNLTWNDGV